MSVCPTVSVLRFYGCCHPCFYYRMKDRHIGSKVINYTLKVYKKNQPCGVINMRDIHLFFRGFLSLLLLSSH